MSVVVGINAYGHPVVITGEAAGTIGIGRFSNAAKRIVLKRGPL